MINHIGRLTNSKLDNDGGTILEKYSRGVSNILLPKAERQTGRQTDGQTNKRTNKQTNMYG